MVRVGKELEEASRSQGAAMDPRWAALIGEVLTTSQVRRLLHLTSNDEVGSLQARGELIALPDRNGNPAYPSFQFTASGEVKPEIPQIIHIFAGSVETPYTIASWLKSPKPYLQHKTPIDWLDHGGNPEPVVAGAEQTAARLAN